MNAKYNLDSSRNKWITWGGSYPGMLAGFSRLKHPELIHASVASSAPVHAVFDMKEYMDWEAKAYTVSHEKVGGSIACRDAIRTAHQWIEDKFRAGASGTVTVETVFGLAPQSLSTLPQKVN